MKIILIIMSMTLVSRLYCSEIQIFATIDDETPDKADSITIKDSEIISIKQISFGGDGKAVAITINKEAGKRNNEFTKSHKGKRIYVYVNALLIAKPKIIEPSKDEFVVSTSLSDEAIKQVVK